MRIAVLGDIHSNLAALEAALAEVAEAGCDLVVHTGGVIGHGARPNETIDLLRSRSITGVRGHFDEDVAWADRVILSPGEGARTAGGARASAGAPPGDRSAGGADGALSWNVRTLGYSQRQYLKDLPFSLPRTVGERQVLLFHASPIDLRQGIDEHASESWLRELADETGAAVHLFGHTHKPFHRLAGDAHFVNAGSVGYPQDGDPRACVAIVTIERGVEVAFRRAEYDVETTIKEIVAAGLPAEATRGFRVGR